MGKGVDHNRFRAAATVCPEGVGADYGVTETEASRKGMYYLSASGDPIPNLGEKSLMLMTESGSLRSMMYQVAKVTKPLGSVSRICKAGHAVVFDDEGSFIYNKSTGSVDWLREENGTYVLDSYIVPKAEAPFQGQGK